MDLKTTHFNTDFDMPSEKGRKETRATKSAQKSAAWDHRKIAKPVNLKLTAFLARFLQGVFLERPNLIASQ